MAFYGVGGDFTNTNATRSSRSDVSHGGNTSYQTAHSNTLTAGVYLVHLSYSPSDSDGEYPNNDPDHWECRITIDGSQVGDTAFGYENTPITYKKSGSLAFVVSWNSGSKTIASQYRTTDADDGGLRGYLITNITIIMEYA